MIMNTLYDTGYNVINLVEELLKIERKISVQPSFFGVMSIIHEFTPTNTHYVCTSLRDTPYNFVLLPKKLV